MTMNLTADLRPLLKPPRIERGYFRTLSAWVVPVYQVSILWSISKAFDLLV